MSKEKRRYTSARERAEKQSTGFLTQAFKIPDGVQVFQPKPGRYLLDIIPFIAGAGNPWADEGCIHWERTYYTHRGIGANGDTYTCPRVTAKERCPVCEHRMKLMKEGDEDNEELIKDLSPKQRQLFQLINLKEPDKGIQLWDISYHLFGKVLDARLRNSEEDEEWDKFFHLEDGMTLKVAFAEKTFGGFAYVEVETIDFRPRNKSYDDDILEEGRCLDDLIIVPEYEDLKKVFLEAKSDKDKDEEEERPKKRRQEEDEDEPPPKKKKPVSEDDDWDDFDKETDEKPKSKKPPVDEDEEDEEPPPKKKRPAPEEDEDDEPPPKKKKTPAEDDDWDDFDKDAEKPRIRAGAPKEEDEDEPAPRKKKRPVEEED